MAFAIPLFTALSVCIAVALVPLHAAAEDKTEIESAPGKHRETFRGDDGSSLEYQEERGKVYKEYKSGDGVIIKEEGNADGVKKTFQDGSCKQETQVDNKTGETKVVTSGNCP